MFKNHYNQNKYITKTYLLKQIFTNMHTEIKFCSAFDTQRTFVNKNKGCYCE